AGGTADEQLSWNSALGDPTRDVKGNPTRAALDVLDFARVGAGSQGEPEVRRAPDHGERAADPTSRALARPHAAVAGCVELVAAEAHELASNCSEVGREQVPPGAIADAFDDGRRADYVGRQNRPDGRFRSWRSSGLLVSGRRRRTDAIGEIACRHQAERAAQ